MPDHAGRGEGNPGIPADGWQLPATPVTTDQDVLDRVTAIIGPQAARDPAPTLWLLFLDAQGNLANLVVPIDGVPDRPDPSILANACYIASEVLADRAPGGSTVITLSRPGSTALTSSDHHILTALQRGAAVHGAPVRMLCLATPGGTRELGPVSPAAPGRPAGDPDLLRAGQPPAPACGPRNGTADLGGPAPGPRGLHAGREHALAVAAAVPGLLGFRPGRSLVLAGQDSDRQTTVTLRYDLPDPPDPALAEAAAGHAAGILALQASTVTAVGFGPDALARNLTEAVARHLVEAGLTVAGALRVSSGRYWCLCGAPECTRGRPLPRTLPETVPGTARTVLASRATLAATVAPLRGPQADSVRRALLALEAAGPPPAVQRLEVLLDTLRRCRRGEAVTSPARAAGLLASLRELPVRDLAWSLTNDPSQAAANLRLWRDLARLAPPGYRAAPASLLAFTAWQDGNGALANVALDQALADDPDYSMAMLLRDAIDLGTPPSMADLPMTPQEVAAAYEITDAYHAALRSHRQDPPAPAGPELE